jgi:PKD repeat protein
VLSGYGDVTGKTSLVITPPSTGTYTLTASNIKGTSSRQITITVTNLGGSNDILSSCPVDRSHVAARMSASLDAIRKMPENSWLRVNQNTMSSVYMPSSLKSSGVTGTSQNAIVNAWGGFAYDPNRGDVITFGGGHGDYPGNDIYRFRLSTMKWELAGISSRIVTHRVSPPRANDPTRAAGTGLPADGLFNAPAVGHMYDQFAFFPKLDRMIYMGGSPNYDVSAETPLYEGPEISLTGPFLFDPSRTDGTKVVGTDGSAVDPSIKGGRMWENRRYKELHPGGFMHGGGFGSQWVGTDVACLNGKEVAFIRGREPDSGNPILMKYQIPDITNPVQDVLSKVGANLNEVGQGDVAVAPEAHAALLILSSSTRSFAYWDISNTSVVGKVYVVSIPSSSNDGFVPSKSMGMDYDPIRKRMLIWDGGSEVWELKVPAGKPAPNTGWAVRRLVATGAENGVDPEIAGSGGANGKWKYAPDLDVFVGLRSAPNGDIWVYKPQGWVAPN